MKDLESMSSDELKEVLSNVEISPSESGEVEQRPDIRQVLAPEDDLDRIRSPEMLRLDEAQQHREEYQALSNEEKLRYHGVAVPAEVEQAQKAAEFAQALTSDVADLYDRYGNLPSFPKGELVAEFQRDLQLGRIKMPPGIERVDNALEALFLQFVDRPSVNKRLRSADLGEIITRANESALRSRSVDIAVPQRVRPDPKPKRPERTYKVPDLSTEDLQEALGDWMKKHPERF